MMTKKHQLELSIKRYGRYLKGRKKQNSKSNFDAGFDFGYNSGLIAAWDILQQNRNSIILEKDKNAGLFRKDHASSVVHKLMGMIGDLSNSEECNCSKLYKEIDYLCESCRKLKA